MKPDMVFPALTPDLLTPTYLGKVNTFYKGPIAFSFRIAVQKGPDRDGGLVQTAFRASSGVPRGAAGLKLRFAKKGARLIAAMEVEVPIKGRG